MKKQLQWFLVILLLLSVVLAACGGGNNEEPATTSNTTNTAVADSTTEDTTVSEPEPTAVPEPIEEPEPTAVPEPTEEPEPTAVPEPTEEPAAVEVEEESIDLGSVMQSLTLSAPQEEDVAAGTAVSSYGFDLLMTFTTTDDSGNETVQTVNMSVAYSTDPPAASILMSAEGVEGAEEFGQIAMAQTGDTVYMSIPQMGCITQTTNEMDLLSGDNPMGDAFSPETLFEEFDLSQAKRVRPDEVINDIEVEHYTFDETMMDDTTSDIQEASGDIYIAKDGGYPVRMIINAVGRLEGFEGADTANDGTIVIEYNLTNYGQPIDVVIPADCENTSAQVDLPMVDDAYEVTSFAGFVSYKSDAAFDDIIAFYEGILAEAGWAKDEDASFSFTGTASLSYTKDQETLTVMISQEGDSGPQSVMLITETLDE